MTCAPTAVLLTPAPPLSFWRNVQSVVSLDMKQSNWLQLESRFLVKLSTLYLSAPNSKHSGGILIGQRPCNIDKILPMDFSVNYYRMTESFRNTMMYSLALITLPQSKMAELAPRIQYS